MSSTNEKLPHCVLSKSISSSLDPELELDSKSLLVSSVIFLVRGLGLVSQQLVLGLGQILLKLSDFFPELYGRWSPKSPYKSTFFTKKGIKHEVRKMTDIKY